MIWVDLAFVVKSIPIHSDEAKSSEAGQAIRKEVSNIVGKGSFNPNGIVDWNDVKFQEGSMIGKAKMILGIKNFESVTERKWKARMVYMGNNLRDGDGMKINDSTDSLWGTPIDLPCARHVFAISLLNGWNIQTADVEAAYLVSDLRGPPVYLRLPPEIWQACDVSSDCLSKFRDPCVSHESNVWLTT